MPENIDRVISLLEKRIDELDSKLNQLNQQFNKRANTLDTSVEELKNQLEKLRASVTGGMMLTWTISLTFFLLLISSQEGLFKLIDQFSMLISSLERVGTFDTTYIQHLKNEILKAIIQKACEIKCDIGDLAEKLVRHFSPSQLLSPETKNLVRKSFGQEALEIWEKIIK
ncbi:MAG: hypothetical protein DRJ38_09450 [Thermoprotei archaeon]|nr:MAG: hypothetical protein DRJ38_09450 [Thermoprotei archaeon]